MKTLLVLAFSLTCFTTQAQFGKNVLERAKQSAKQKVNNKIDQKTNEGIDKVLDAPEKAAKKNKKGQATTIDETDVSGTSTDNGTPTPAPANDNTMSGEGAQTVIQTNILCESGKKKIEALLKKQDGVFEVKTNIANGELAIRYSSDGTSYTTLLQLINEQGFEADGNKPSASAPANPCKKGKN
ncbi:heavy-metal-associated domain-containing protein [Ferruginibacter sp. HRS2-29]|uniref:heavy-metal-associated domain-containing protein n=1 Tax=Ferruginibacter sp. HRS2-29 TaxID=2487334 RepID=UPI0020CFCC96|nr:heavy metal-associated domain-containing protein [Ferruginibacter sp. HRS2-29]MCP9752773.1 heavy-metal-associated domain-containing protein [Ferruginibacter sp. HRS2-29]